jgi:hypothetical protein
MHPSDCTIQHTGGVVFTHVEVTTVITVMIERVDRGLMLWTRIQVVLDLNLGGN